MKKTTISLQSITSFGSRALVRARKMLWFFARHAFLFIILIILFEALLGEWIFYQYIYLAQFRNPDLSSIPTRFKENTYQSVLDTWTAREQNARQANSSVYQNPFH